jgi:hypothetical protein
MANGSCARPRATTIQKLDRVDSLTRSGVSVADACYTVGLDPQTWYRRRPPEVELDQAQAVLELLRALTRKAA